MASVFIVAALLVATAQADPLGYYGMAPLNLTVAPFPGNYDEQGPYIGGDMRFGENQLAELKSGIQGSSYRWPLGRIPTEIDSSFSNDELNTIYDALIEIQQKTCIRFYTVGSSSDYISIVRGTANSGCWSYVGKQGGKQQVNIQPGNPGCVFKGIIAHEIIHAIGFFHEQSRPDRDDFVTINFENVQSGMEHNFDKYSTSQVSTFNTPYDYKSIMHYSAYAFSTNGRPTIEPKNGMSPNELGQRAGLSASDAQKINNMYKGICQ